MIRRGIVSVTGAVVTLVVIVSLVFILTSLIPGDVATQIAGGNHAAAEQIRHDLHLDDPLLIRLASWWKSVVTGHLGQSWINGADVGSVVMQRMVHTLCIVLPAWLLAAVAGTGLAVTLAVMRTKMTSSVLSGVVTTIAAIPEIVVVVALVLILGVKLRLLPAVSIIPPGDSPLAHPKLLVLPVLGLALPSAAWMARFLRGPAEEILETRLYNSAIHRGMPITTALRRVVFGRLVAPSIQVYAATFVGLIGSGVVVEAVLNYPGVGGLLANALQSHDTPMVQGVALVISVMAMAVYTAADMISDAWRWKVTR